MMKTTAIKTITNNPSGFTLIEVLIAIVILSIGLLGMAGIQVQGLRGTTNSALRSQATILANDFAERTHVNFVAVPGGQLNTTYGNVNTADNSIDCNTPPQTICSVTPNTAAADLPANGCTAAQMATYDIFVFACGDTGNGGVNNLLPNGSATVTCNDVANGCPIGSELTVNINWQEITPSDGQNIDKTVTMVFVP